MKVWGGIYCSLILMTGCYSSVEGSRRLRNIYPSISSVTKKNESKTSVNTPSGSAISTTKIYQDTLPNTSSSEVVDSTNSNSSSNPSNSTGSVNNSSPQSLKDSTLASSATSIKFNKPSKTKYYCREFSAQALANNNWRNVVLNEITPERYPLFFNTVQTTPYFAKDLMKFCPNFENLTNDEKKIIILRIIDAMVFFESSCNPSSHRRGPNGRAQGILQLHLGKEQEYASACKKYDSKNPKRSLLCGLDMLHNQLENSRLVFSSGSYWEVLRPKARSNKAKYVVNQIWYYPLCQGSVQHLQPLVTAKN